MPLWRTEERRSLVINNQITRDCSHNDRGGFTMLCRVLLAVVLAVSPMLAHAGPKEDAQEVFERFLTTFTAADVDAVVDVFWPDALFWGTTKPDLATTPEAVRAYFKAGLGSMKPNELKATSLATSALVVSDSVVLISGLWQ